jgi:hypothetical protein
LLEPAPARVLVPRVSLVLEQASLELVQASRQLEPVQAQEPVSPELAPN